MPDTILSGDITIFPSTENNRKAIKWTGSSTGTRTARALYSALEAWAALPGSIGQLVPIKADTPDIFRMINQWFVDDETVEHLTGGSLYSDKWKDGTTEHVLVIGYGQTVEFNAADIGRTIRGATTGDTGTILDFNAARKLLWIRPDDPLAAGDEFDNGAESYAIGAAADGDVVAKCFQDDAGFFTDMTTEVNNATANDVIFPATEAISDALDFGFALKFSKLRLNVGTAGDATGVVVWEYWNGTAWVALAGVSDGTTGLETSGTNNLTFTVPTDWATTSISGSAQLYFVRVRITTVFTTTNPAITQGWISGVGAGAFATHNRHGVASKAGESAWVGLTTKGTLEANTHQYGAQESLDSTAGSFDEKLVVATKGSSDWWGDGKIDVLLKVKEADSIIGQLPNSSPATAVASVFARQYTKNYAHAIETALATAGGNTVAPLSTTDDGDNTVGPRNLAWDAGSSETLADQELLYNVGTSTAGNLDAGVQDDGGVFTNDTTDLNDVAGGGDVAVFPATEATNDAFYFGKDNVFTLLMVDVATQGVSSSAATAWEYYNGSTWAALTVVDDSNSGNGAFTAAVGRRLISWSAPSDWARVAVTNQPAAAPAKLFYVRVRITAANYSTVPVLETAWCGGEAQLKARVADAAIGTPSGATGDANYYLLGDPLVDFSDNDVVVAATSRKTININGAPTNTTGGPAADDTNLVAVHGQFTRDIDENGVVDPYSIDVQNSTNLLVQRIYEWTKYVTRQGATATTDTDEQQGQFYVGSELQVEYTSQAGGAFTQSRWVYDQTTDAKGFIVADHDDGATGDLILRTVRGTFTAGNVLSDSPDPTQAMNTNSFCYQVDAGAAEAINAIVDQSADALDAGAGDVTIFPASEDTNDYFAVGARKPFALVRFDNTGGTAGTVGTATWQYWNGSTWAALSPTDGTTGFTAAVGVQNVTFYPPADWQARGLSSGTVNTPTLYFIRAKVSGLYTVQPLYDTVGVEDNVTASIGSV
ncbi:MAG: hypothetical protein Q8S13_11950, partial [Dehalococcoidia bacterium]|nr:hypothetical protein [Dehalococcoidia bacterium]